MMINKKRFLINNIPTLIWGPDSDKVYIYVHGKMGSKENAEHYFTDSKSLEKLEMWL